MENLGAFGRNNGGGECKFELKLRQDEDEDEA
jgi:hypothetical protein